MPAMYPEELRDLRARHPELQYDFRGNVIGTTPLDSVQQAADAIYQLPGMQPNAWDFGPTRNDYLNSRDFVGPMPQQWWDPSGDLMQRGQDWLGGFMQGFDLQPQRAARPRNPYVQRQTPAFGGQMVPPEVRYQQDGGVDPAYQADLLRQTQQMPFMQSARRAAGNVAFFGDPANETFPNLAYQQE